MNIKYFNWIFHYFFKVTFTQLYLYYCYTLKCVSLFSFYRHNLHESKLSFQAIKFSNRKFCRLSLFWMGWDELGYFLKTKANFSFQAFLWKLRENDPWKWYAVSFSAMKLWLSSAHNKTWALEKSDQRCEAHLPSPGIVQKSQKRPQNNYGNRFKYFQSQTIQRCIENRTLLVIAGLPLWPTFRERVGHFGSLKRLNTVDASIVI